MGKYTFKEADKQTAVVLTGYGAKGHGKTSALMGLSGKQYWLSFDGKTKRIQDSRYSGDNNVFVIDAMEYFDESLPRMPASGKETYEYIKWNLQEIASRGDANWVCLDYFPRMVKAMEMAMRFNNGLTAKAAFSNRSLWDERNAMLFEIHELALKAVKERIPGKRHGLVYTTYLGEDITEKRDGETFHSRKKPRYQGYAEERTDVILYVERLDDVIGGPKFTVKVESNKLLSEPPATTGIASIKDGTTLDLTGGKRLRDLVSDL